jgi:hypothetical protein
MQSSMSKSGPLLEMPHITSSRYDKPSDYFPLTTPKGQDGFSLLNSETDRKLVLSPRLFNSPAAALEKKLTLESHEKLPILSERLT